jgi:hypothetical protein
MLFDASRNPMTPSHAVKKDTLLLLQCLPPTDHQIRPRAPPGCASRLRRSSSSCPAVCPNGFSIPAASTMQHGFSMRQRSLGSWREPENSATAGPACPRHASRALLTALIERIDVGTDRIDIHIRPTGLGALLDVAPGGRRIRTIGPAKAAMIIRLTIRSTRAVLCRTNREHRDKMDGSALCGPHPRNLRPGDFVKVDCAACPHTGLLVREADRLALRAKLAPAFWSRLGLSRSE